MIFYYCRWYESKQEDIRVTDAGNVNHHGGHNIHSLCVPKKYESFKAEILAHLGVAKYTKFVRGKAERYIDTDMARRIEATDQERDLHYEIERGTPLSIPNLMALILYCDFTDLSREFTSSFRAVRPSEPFSSIKSRNSEYWWWSKTLRETVEYFGNNRYGRFYGNEFNASTGPYYCGMSELMAMPLSSTLGSVHPHRRAKSKKPP